jgi:hypothetical protein
MVRADKLFEAMKSNPAGNWQIGDVEAICRRYGLTITPPRGGGSHFNICRPGGSAILTIPAHRPILPVYIRALVSLVEEVLK